MKTADFKDLIVFEDEDYVLINKPSGISSLDERTEGPTNILKMAREYHPDIQIGHRLDKETSGILALAKNAEAYRNLAIQFEDRHVEKIYHAVVDGIHEFKETMVELPILTQSRGQVKIDRSGKAALTIFNTLKVFRKNTLVECIPLTGRMHQIRIHLVSLRAPITGDLQYGGKDIFLSELKRNFNLKKETEEWPLIRRFALHARSLRFIAMDGKTIVEGIADYPKDFEVLVKQLDKYS